MMTETSLGDTFVQRIEWAWVGARSIWAKIPNMVLGSLSADCIEQGLACGVVCQGSYQAFRPGLWCVRSGRIVMTTTALEYMLLYTGPEHSTWRQNNNSIKKNPGK